MSLQSFHLGFIIIFILRLFQSGIDDVERETFSLKLHLRPLSDLFCGQLFVFFEDFADMFQRFLYLIIKCKRTERLLDGIVVYSFRFQLAEKL